MFSHIFIYMDTKLCVICNTEKNIDDFYKSQRGRKCIDCVLKKARVYKKIRRSNPEFRKIEGQKQKERRVRLWQNTLIHDSKHRNIENTLTVEDINEMFENQKGLCYWFKIPLIPSNKSKHPQQPSIDRLDRSKGYTKDNVVLCCYSANIGRNENDLDTWEQFIKLLNIDI
jgi:hypothetical protein